MDNKIIYQSRTQTPDGELRFTEEQFNQRRKLRLTPLVWVGADLGLITERAYRELLVDKFTNNRESKK